MRKKTHEEFVNEVSNLCNKEYSVLGEYKNTGTKILVKHNICGVEYTVTPNHFLGGTRCPQCFGTSRGMTDKEFRDKIKSIYNDQYVVIGKYIKSNTKVLIRHNDCGNEFNTRPNNLLRGYGCPKCYGTPKKSHDEFIKIIKELTNNEFTVLSEYDGRDKKVKIKHNQCGHIFNAVPRGFFEGNGCPKCKESKGEKEICKVLTQNNISFKSQYRNKKCGYKRSLIFDFAIIEDDNIVSLIEYNGKQHYNCIEYFGGIKSLKSQQGRDQIKRDYCKNNGIPLIEIPYTIKDIGQYLETKLQQLSIL